MQRTVALRERGRLAALLNTIVHHARQHPTWQEPDRRNLRTWRQLVLAILVQRTTRLLTLAQALLPQRQATTVKRLAESLSYFLTDSQCAVAELSPCLLEAALAQLDLIHLVRYRGHVLLVLDPTEYPKRSRGKGKRNRHMQHVGRVRNAKGKRSGTTAGYVDVWAGVVLKGKRFLPLARQLFSSRHPNAQSQNQVEAQVLTAARGALERLGLSYIVVADRGVGRKAQLIRLANQEHPFVIRIDPDITVHLLHTGCDYLLADLLAQQPWLGEVDWDRGAEGVLRCRVRKVRGRIRYSCSGRKNDVEEASMTFLECVPLDGSHEPLVLATTLPVYGLTDAQGVVRVYGQRWAVESGFEVMKAWGLEDFMVRQWGAIERLLWIVALAYALATLTLYRAVLARFRADVGQVLRQWGALGRCLTAGQVAEAVGVDYQQHHRAWKHVWLP